MKNAFTVHTFSNSKLTMLSLIPTKLAMEIPKPMLNQHLVFAKKIELICVGYIGGQNVFLQVEGGCEFHISH